MQSFVTGAVVKITIIEKSNVQIGSATANWLPPMYKNREAIITPTLYRASPFNL